MIRIVPVVTLTLLFTVGIQAQTLDLSPQFQAMQQAATVPVTFMNNMMDSINQQYDNVAASGAGGQQDNGTNPAQNATTFIFSNEFYRLYGGNEINTTYARFKFPILEKKGAVIFELPYKFYDLNSPIEAQVGGTGDVKVQVNYNAFVSCDKSFTLVTMLEMFIPSADNVLLTNIPDSNQFTAMDVGSGKFILGPGVGAVYAFAPNFIMAPLYFFEKSVWGADNRADVSRGKLRVFMMYAFDNGLYVLPEAQLVSNFITGNQDAYLAPEFGYATKGTTFYVKPGWGIQPDTNDRSWGLEFGMRIMF
jgi:hypothetical protein